MYRHRVPHTVRHGHRPVWRGQQFVLRSAISISMDQLYDTHRCRCHFVPEGEYQLQQWTQPASFPRGFCFPTTLAVSIKKATTHPLNIYSLLLSSLSMSNDSNFLLHFLQKKIITSLHRHPFITIFYIHVITLNQIYLNPYPIVTYTKTGVIAPPF